MYRVQMGMNGPTRFPALLTKHKAIINAIANRDGELAELLMRRHIGASRINIEKTFINQGEKTMAHPHSAGALLRQAIVDHSPLQTGRHSQRLYCFNG